MQIIQMDCGCTINAQGHSITASDQCPIHGGTQTTFEIIAPRIADVSCAKCGSPEVRLRYEDGDGHCDTKQCGATAYVAGRGYCREEHFHRTCERCLFRWTTWQVLPLDS